MVMRTTRNLMVLLGALALAFGMNSCSDYDNGYTSKDIAYKEQFYNMFGNADPNHTWNMAQSRSLDVTINSEGTYTVKVWTANPRLGESNAFTPSTHATKCSRATTPLRAVTSLTQGATYF